MAQQEFLSYGELEQDGFRLLEIHPGSARDPLQVTVKHASLLSPPPYSALSYTWGDPKDPFYMKCGEINLRVTKSLHEALCQVRSPEETITIWADAICINQRDNAEKSIQVARMKEIYSKASRLFIWLGHPAKIGDEDVLWGTFSILEGIFSEYLDDEMRNAMASARPSRQQRGGLDVWKRALLIEQHLVDCQIQESHWLSVVEFYSKPWFTRVWIFQEAVSVPGNEKTDIIIGYGNRTIPWDSLVVVTHGLADAAGVIDRLKFSGHFPLPLIEAIRGERSRLRKLTDAGIINNMSFMDVLCLEVLQLKGFQINNPIPMDKYLDLFFQGVAGYQDGTGQLHFLYYLLGLSRTLDATDPRDHLFAFSGLLHDRASNPRLNPNYDKSIIDVFVDITLFFLQDLECLGIFELLDDKPRTRPHPNSEMIGLPSWANDWTQKSYLNLFGSTGFSAGGAHTHGKTKHASRVQVSSDCRKLGFQAYLVGEIRQVVPADEDFTSEYMASRLAAKLGRPKGQIRIITIRGGPPKPELNTADRHPAARYTEIVDCARVLEIPDPLRTNHNEIRLDRGTPPRQDMQYVTGESLYEAFWRSLVWNKNMDGRRADDGTRAEFEAYHKALTNSHQFHGNEDFMEDVSRFGTNHARFAGQRQFCIIQKGFMGWVTRSAKVGDVISIIPGARMPYVIRRVEDEWELIGHAYVHGLMEDVVQTDTIELTENGNKVLGTDAEAESIWVR